MCEPRTKAVRAAAVRRQISGGGMQQGDNSFDLTGGMSAVLALSEQRGGVAQCLLPGDIVEKLES